MTSLMIVGGVHGVGKTTLIRNVLPKGHPGTTLLDPGALVRKHVYQDRDKTFAAVELMVAHKLVAHCHCPTTRLVLAPWHFAVWTPTGYVPQMSVERWRLVVHGCALDRLYLVKVTAPPETVLTRCIRDYENHPRICNLEAVREEMRESDYWYRRFAEEAGTFVEVIPTELSNVGIESALGQMEYLYLQAYSAARAVV